MTPFQNERAFTRWVLKEARARDWKAYHFGNSMRNVRRSDGSVVSIPDGDATGFPDCVLVRERVMFVELKMRTRGSKLRPAQRDCLIALRLADADVHVWHSDQQTEILRILDGGDAAGMRLFSSEGLA